MAADAQSDGPPPFPVPLLLSAPVRQVQRNGETVLRAPAAARDLVANVGPIPWLSPRTGAAH